MAGITSTGLGTGLDIKKMVGAIVGAEKEPALATMVSEKEKATSAISAYGVLNNNLDAFKDSYSALSRKSTFSAASASSSDSSVLDVTLGVGAETGSWDFEVKQKAKAQSIVSPSSHSYEKATSEVGMGEISFAYGTYEEDGTFSVNPNQEVETLTIDASNNSLGKLRDSINEGNYSVSASVVNDGDNYRLVLTNKNTGEANAMQLTVVDSDGNNQDASGLSSLTYSADVKHMEKTETAQDAKIVVDGIQIKRPTNNITSVIEGVTLNIGTESKVGEKVSLTIVKDTTIVSDQIKAFVENYNNTISEMNELTAFAGEGGEDGVLNGDSTVRNIKTQMRTVLNTSMTHIDGAVKSFADLGMLTNRDGTLTLDENKMNQVMDTDMESIADFFTASGGASDPLINFESKGYFTRPGSYDVEVNKFATQGKLTGEIFNLKSLPITLDSDNNSFKVRLDGFLSNDIELTPKTYQTMTDLVDELQSQINSDNTFSEKGLGVNVYEEDGAINIASKRYGTVSTVAINEIEDSAFFTRYLGLSVAGGVNGEDAEGFIDGKEAAGDGQLLRSIEGPSQGIVAEVKGGELGPRGTISHSEGMGAMLNNTLDGIIDFNISSAAGDVSVSNTTIDGKVDSLFKQIQKVSKQEETLNYRMEKLEARLYKQFNAMDGAVSGLDNLKAYMTATLDNLPGYTNN
ncbi:flagellar filament capping protein FliD [Psychromonas algicola]|uniref:flagellar filament capping protein FliD n=1 Tax=Psychromonas algicola TaxID=2555642 RepID=UPI0010679A18|nr:flagellar filament capping protein FliD [Psychromonas sp. RZ5]TEW51615.1 flagellar hook-associated protein [Psychromonas sp. RZ5]